MIPKYTRRQVGLSRAAMIDDMNQSKARREDYLRSKEAKDRATNNRGGNDIGGNVAAKRDNPAECQG